MKDLPESEGSENREREERKRIIVALRVVLALKINCSNNNSPPRTFSSSSLICVCSSLKSLLSVNPLSRSPALSPTLYKFIVLGPLGSYPGSFGFELQIVTLQYIYVCVCMCEVQSFSNIYIYTKRLNLDYQYLY